MKIFQILTYNCRNGFQIDKKNEKAPKISILFLGFAGDTPVVPFVGNLSRF